MHAGISPATPDVITRVCHSPVHPLILGANDVEFNRPNRLIIERFR